MLLLVTLQDSHHQGILHHISNFITTYAPVMLNWIDNTWLTMLSNNCKDLNCNCKPFKRQYYKMVKHTQTIRRQRATLALNGLNSPNIRSKVCRLSFRCCKVTGKRFWPDTLLLYWNWWRGLTVILSCILYFAFRVSWSVHQSMITLSNRFHLNLPKCYTSVNFQMFIQTPYKKLQPRYVPFWKTRQTK